MLTLAYILILISATIHASWNTLARHLKGNTPALVIAHFVGSLMLFPFTFLDKDAFSIIFKPSTLLLLVLSLVAHASYVLLLSTAYVHGEIGLVYPLARGTAIVLATVASQLLGIDKKLTGLAVCGILVVVFGISLLAVDAMRRSDLQLPRNAIEAVTVEGSNDRREQELTETMPSVPLGHVQDSATVTLTDKNETSPESEIEPPQDISSTYNPLISPSQPLSDNTTSSSEGPLPPPRDRDAPSDYRKLFLSIFLAMGVGMCTATYSIVDSLGVQIVSPTVWAFLYNFISNPCLLPLLYFSYPHDTRLALQLHKRSILVIAPCVVGAYYIILIVFTLRGVDVALVVTLREFAVLIGAFFGVVFLGERYSWTKFAAILCMLAGMLVLKFA